MSKLEDKLAASIKTGQQKAPAARKSVAKSRADQATVSPAVSAPAPAANKRVPPVPARDVAPASSPFQHPRRVWPD